MKKRKMVYLMMAAALLASCSADQEGQEIAGRAPIRLGYSVAEVQTRAATDLNDTNIPTGETVKVLIRKSSAAWGSGTDGYTAAGYEFSADGSALSCSPAPEWPDDGSSIDIMAYYPSDAATSFSVAVDQTVDADYKASDLMVAEPVVNQFRTNAKVNLQFHHKMAKVIVNATPEAGSNLTITGITLTNVKPQVSFTPTTASISDATGSASSVTMTNNGAALIPPQTISGRFIEVSIQGKDPAYYSVDGKAFISGHQYTIALTVNSSNIGVTNAITNWTEENVPDIVGGMQAAFTIADDISDQEYTGTAKEPSFTTVQCDGNYVAPSNYDVYYTDNVIPGTASIVLVGKNDYEGIYGVKEFTITAKTVANATTDSYRGWIIASDGYIYQNKDDVVKAGKTAVAMIVHVGSSGENSPYNHGLGMALRNDAYCIWSPNDTNLGNVPDIPNSGPSIVGDVSGISHTNNIISSYPSSTTAASVAKNHAAQVTNCSQWFLPAIGQWIYVFNSYGAGITSSNAINNGYSVSSTAATTVANALYSHLENAGGDVGIYCWSSSEFTYEYAYRPFIDETAGIYVGYTSKKYGYTVRAFLAF